MVNQKGHSVGFFWDLLTKYCLSSLLANLLRASNELRGNKANTKPFPILPTALPPTSSLNVFLTLCVFDLSAPTELSKNFQRWFRTSKAGFFVSHVPLVRFLEIYVNHPMASITYVTFKLEETPLCSSQSVSGQKR